MAAECLLRDIPVGSCATITTAAASPTVGRRLRELGLRRGAEITVMQKTSALPALRRPCCRDRPRGPNDRACWCAQCRQNHTV